MSMQLLYETIEQLMSNDTLVEKILTEGTHYDSDAVKMLVNSGLFDEERSRFIVDALINEDIHAFNHVPGTILKYIKGIVRMLIDYSNGSTNKAVEFLSECPRIFEPYITWVKEVRPKITSQKELEKFDNKFLKQMSYEDVKNELEKIQAKSDEESNSKLSNMTFEKESNYVLVPIDSYNQLHSMFGRKWTGNQTEDGSEWCHTNIPSVYDSWTQDGRNKFFVLARKDWKNIKIDAESNKENPKDEYGNSLIALLVSTRNGRLMNATLRCNHVGVPHNADNQYTTYAQLSEIAGFNVKEEVKKNLPTIEELVKIDEKYIKDITLLSIEEVEKIDESLLEYDCWWWLRSPGGTQNNASTVDDDGSVDYFGYFVNYFNVCVRPALTISNLKSYNLKIGQSVLIFNKKWVVIFDNAVLYDDNPIYHRFDKRTNDYDKSEIKKFIHTLLYDRFNFDDEDIDYIEEYDDVFVDDEDIDSNFDPEDL